MSDTIYWEVKLYNYKDLYILSHKKENITLNWSGDHFFNHFLFFLLSVAFTNPKIKIRSWNKTIYAVICCAVLLYQQQLHPNLRWCSSGVILGELSL